MTVNDFAIRDVRPSETPGWRGDSECRKHPTHWWFAGGHRETLEAKSICARCPVQGPCLDFALSRADLLGIWAGTTPNERTAVRRSRRPRNTTDIVFSEIDILPEADIPPGPKTRPEPKILPGTGAATPRPGAPVDPTVAVVPLGLDLSGQHDLLTPAEAAHKLGVTPNTVTRWSRAGKISAIQTMGGHRRFRRAEIERVLHAADLDTATPSSPVHEA